MFSSVISGALSGIDSQLIRVEADVTNGLPGFSMVGFLSSEVREAQDRVRAALSNSGFPLPPRKIVISLAPGDVKKGGSGFDLPIAIALLQAYGILTEDQTEGYFFSGELGLNGEIRPIPGVLQMTDSARKAGCSCCMIPSENTGEAAVISGITVYGVSHLKEAIGHLLGSSRLSETKADLQMLLDTDPVCASGDFADIRGQEMVKRAAEIAVAGRHNLLISGPPGSGKTMIARRIPTILPKMSLEEAIEVSRIHSVAGLLPPEGILTSRPFRMPHHTISSAGLAGGGKYPKPGEISLAHRGVLYMDELPEFRTETLEILRQPLEEREILISRNSGSFCFPADFILIASRNPCKCGYFPDRTRCRCSVSEVKKYLHRISQPLLDRIDIHVEAEEIPFEKLMEHPCRETSQMIRERVERAYQIQARRYRDSVFRFNGELNAETLYQYCLPEPECQSFLEEIYRHKNLTARTCHRLLKVARTIADLEGCDQIEKKHLSEAVCYRPVPELEE